MIKYLARSGSGKPSITIVEIERETEDHVWINGEHWWQESSAEKYCNTFEDARYYLVCLYSDKAQSARSSLTQLEKSLQDARALAPQPEQERKRV